jgi:hypothetical protein
MSINTLSVYYSLVALLFNVLFPAEDLLLPGERHVTELSEGIGSAAAEVEDSRSRRTAT